MEPPPPAEKILRRKHRWRWPLRIAGLLFILLVALYFGRNRLLAPFLLDFAAAAAGEALGGEFSVEEFDGNWYDSATIRGIRTERAGTATPLQTIELDELVAEYSLWDWLTGKPDWFRSLRGNGLRLEVDLRQGLPADPPEADDAALPFEAPAWLPSWLPVVELRQLELVLDGEDLHLEVPAASLSTSLLTPGRHRLVLEAELKQFAAKNQRVDDARLRVEADWLAGELELPHLEATLDHGNERLHAIGHLDRERLAVVVEGRDFQIGPYAAAAGYDLALTLGWKADLRLPWADPAAAEAELELSGTGFTGFGYQLDRIESRLVVADRQLRDGSLELVAPEGTVKVSGLSLPLDPTMSVAELARRTELDLELRLAQLPALLARLGIDLEGLPAVTEEMILVGGKRGDELRFDQAGVLGADGGFSLHGLRLQVGGEEEMLTAHGIRLPLEFQLERSWTTAEGVELPPLAGKMTIAVLSPVSVGGLPAQTQIALEDLELRAEDGSVRLSEEARIEWNLGQDLRIEKLVLETPAGTLALEATLPLAFGAEDILGEGELMARGSLSGFDLARIRPLLKELELPVERGRADLSWELSGRWEAPVLRLAVDGRDWVLAPLAAAVPTGPFAFGMELSYADGKAEIRNGRLDGDGIGATWSGELALPLNLRELAAGTAPALDGGLRAVAEIRSQELGWIAELAPELHPSVRSGRLAVTAAGTLNAPVLTAEAVVVDLALGAEPGPPIRLDLRARHAGGMLEIEECRATAEGLVLTASGSLPLAADLERPLTDGPVDFQVELERLEMPGAAALAAPFFELPRAEGNLSAILALAGSWDALKIDGTFHSQDLRVELPDAELPDTELPLESFESFELDARFGWANGSATLSQLELRSELARLDAEGAMVVALDPRGLLAGKPLELGRLQGNAELSIPDLSWTAALPQILRAEGEAQARIDIRGTTDALDYDGEIQLEDVELRFARPELTAITALDLDGTFDQETVTIESLTGELGAEPFEARGTVRYAGVPEPEIDLSFNGTNLLLYRAQGVKLRATSKLRIHGPLSQATVDGRIKITDGKLVKNVEFLRLPVGAPAPPSPDGIKLFSLAPPLDGLQFNIKIVSTAEGLHLYNNIARGYLRPELELTGNGAVPVLLGTVYLDQMVLSLPATRLELGSSKVEFRADRPYWPRLAITGSMRRYGYDVNMSVTGPYDQPEVLFSSVPPLTQEELVLLVSTGQPPEGRLDVKGVMSSVAIYLAQDFLRTFLGDESTEAEESVLDRLEIYTGRDTTRQGEETIEGRFLMFDEFLFDDDSLYLESEKDSYGDFNIGLKLLIRFP